MERKLDFCVMSRTSYGPCGSFARCVRINPFNLLMHDVETWSNFKNHAFTPQDFESMFGYFSILYMKG